MRLADFGRPTQFWVEKTVGAESYAVPNKAFYQQFYSLPIDEPQWRESEFEVPVNKSPDAYRVFIFGGSAAMGVPPDTAYAFWRCLEAMLNARFPEIQFEFYCVAMAGANSNVMRAAAIACGKMQPDLFIVYMGNNEFSGPMGPTSGLARWGLYGQGWVKAALFLGNLRLSQLLSDQAWERRTSSDAQAKAGGADTMCLALEDPRRAKTYALFAENVDDICRAAQEAGAEIILSTVGANLRQCAPYKSLHRATLSPEERGQWEQEYERAVQCAKGSQYEEALLHFSAALAIDETFAELHYRMARVLWELGRFDAAREHFTAAAESDGWPVRTGIHINDLIWKIVAAHPTAALLADAQETLLQQSQNRTPGSEFFFDNVHMNLRGNYTVATAVYAQIAPRIQKRLNKNAPPPEPLTREECEEYLAFSPSMKLDHLNGYLDVYNRPAISELNKADNIPVLSAQKADLLAVIGNANPRDINREAYERALRRLPRDFILQLRLARLLTIQCQNDAAIDYAQQLVQRYPCSRKARFCLAEALQAGSDFEAARKQYVSIVELYPDDTGGYLALSDTSKQLGDLESADNYFKKGLFLNPDHPNYLRAQARICEARGEWEQAIDFYQRACEKGWSDPTSYLALARLLDKRNRSGEALQVLRKASEIFPELPRVNFELAAELQALSRNQEAQECYGQIADMPDQIPAVRAEALLKLADLLLQEGRKKDAETSILRAFAADTANTDTYAGLKVLLDKHADPEFRIALWETLAQTHPQEPRMHEALGAEYESQGNLESAAQAYKTAIQAGIADQEALRRFAALFLEKNQLDEALTCYSKLRASSGQDSWERAEINTQMGKLYMAQARNEEALTSFREVIEKNAEYEEAYLEIERLLDANMPLAQRAEIWQGIAAAHPEEPRIQVRLGRTLQAMGNAQGAIAAYLAAAHRGYLDPAMFAALSALLFQQGRGDEAVETLRDAVERFPGSPQIRVELGKAYQKMNRLQEALACFEEARASDGLDPAGQQELEARMAEIPTEIRAGAHRGAAAP